MYIVLSTALATQVKQVGRRVHRVSIYRTKVQIAIQPSGIKLNLYYFLLRLEIIVKAWVELYKGTVYVHLYIVGTVVHASDKHLL